MCCFYEQDHTHSFYSKNKAKRRELTLYLPAMLNQCCVSCGRAGSVGAVPLQQADTGSPGPAPGAQGTSAGHRAPLHGF